MPIDGRVTIEGDIVHAGARRCAFDQREAVLAVDGHDGDAVVVSGPRLALWRAPTDNDGLKLFLDRTDGWTEEEGKPLARWLGWGLDDLHREVDDRLARRASMAPRCSRRTPCCTAPTRSWSSTIARSVHGVPVGRGA